MGSIRTRGLTPEIISSRLGTRGRQGFLGTMKPLISETQDNATLQALGRASVQIVHDLKNQLNGLKLYATFLRKRMEKGDRPADEHETITKLIAGLERAAADMNTLVQYGRPLELRRQPQTDLIKILNNLENGAGIKIEAQVNSVAGDFDVAALTEALKTITYSAVNMRPAIDAPPLNIRLRLDDDGQKAIIEWAGVKTENDEDPFHSFAGSHGLRIALAAKVIEAHGGDVGYGRDILRVSLPLASQESGSAIGDQ